MPSVYDLKPAFQGLLAPAVRGLHAIGITANQVTVAALILSFGIGAAFWWADTDPLLFLVLPIGLLLRMALNAIDGQIARTFDQKSRLGEVLNEVGDVLSDLAIFFPLLKHAPDHTFLVVVFLLLCPVNEFAGLMGRVLGRERRYDGPMGKSDRALVFGLYGLLMAFGVDVHEGMGYILPALCVLIALSTFTRLRKAVRA
jgi:CDP-diacylglycerol---glycerol-3-phosphate 3-phosphatidyltransferase